MTGWISEGGGPGTKWSARRAEWDKLGVLLSAAKLCEEFIADVENVLTSQDEAELNTNEASAMTGYSRERLLVCTGRVSCGDTGRGSTCSSGRGTCRGSRGEGGRRPNAAVADTATRAGAKRLAERLGLAGKVSTSATSMQRSL